MSDAVVPKLTGWDFAARERELFGSAPKQITTWRLANQSRRMLAAVLFELSNEMEIPDVAMIDDLPATAAQQMACVALGGIVIRSAGAMLSLVSCGYEREALAHFRVVVEAELRGLQLVADASGEVARKILNGHRPGSLKTVANRFADQDEVRFITLLDRVAHPDPLAMLPLMTPRAREGEATEMDVEVRPQRGVIRPTNQLLMLARANVKFSVILSTEAFGRPIAIPRWISNQLAFYRDNPLRDDV